ncbi:MAG: LysE family translocator [Rhodospirillales bacterium]
MFPISADVLSLFVVSSCALALAPGPDNIFVLTQSAMNGRAAGLLVTLGLCTGLLFHTAAVAVGVAAVFATSAIAFTILKIVGAAYLIYLAWGAFRATGTVQTEGEGSPIAGAGLYLRGVVMNVTNPKVAIFFLAFLPQFADPARGSVTWQIVLLGAVFMAVTLCVFGTVAWFSGFVGEKIRKSPRVQSTINKVAGVVFLGLAGRLLITER